MTTEYLLERQRKLLRLLNASHGCMTGAELSEKLGVSGRTVRKDVSEINQIIDPAAARILASRGKGYALRVEDRSAFHHYISAWKSLLTREDRIRRLMLTLLWMEEPLDLEQLEEEMFVSRTTLEADLRLLKKGLSPYGIRLSRRDSELSIVADERAVRALILRIYSENLDFSSHNGIVMPVDFPNLELLHIIRRQLREGLRRQGILLDDFRYMYCAIAFWLACRRRGKLRDLPPPDGWEGAPMEAVLYTVSLLPKDIFAEYPEEIHWLNTVLAALLPAATGEPVRLASLLRQVSDEQRLPFREDALLLRDVASYLRDCAEGLAFPKFHTQYVLGQMAAAHPRLAVTAERLVGLLRE